jgi:dephospho-CoA kinase
MTVILGLTGSIGMGKTTTAQFFRALDVPVFDADAVVHDLYKTEAVDLIEQAFPGTKTNDGVDRKKLGAAVIGQPEALKKLEALIHPLVQKKRQDFIKGHQDKNTPVIVLDIPLLFETKADQLCDFVIVVTAAAELQKKRVMERGTMTQDQFETILKKQMPDAEKRARANYVIETDYGLDHARQQVEDIVRHCQAKARNS